MPQPSVRIGFAEDFIREIERLKKKYPHIKEDIQPLINQLKQGETPGDRLKYPGVILYKDRARNTDAQKGTRGGYRVIYLVVSAVEVVMFAVYSKLEKSDIRESEIDRRLEAIMKKRDKGE